MGKGVKTISKSLGGVEQMPRQGAASSVYYTPRGIYKKAPEGKALESARELVMDRGIDLEHLEKAELLTDALLEVLGAEYEDVLARLNVAPRDLGEGLLIEYVSGQSMHEAYAQASRQARKAENYEDLERQKANFFHDGAISRKQWFARLRRIVFIDTIVANSDRHRGNIILSPEGPVGIDQGMAFTPERGLWETKERPIEPSLDADIIVDQTGGVELLPEERRALESIVNSGWLSTVQAELGEDLAREAQKRIAWMLQNNKLYPYVTGTAIHEQSRAWMRKKSLSQSSRKEPVPA